jgi:predicted alpha/beta hydrolase
MPASLRGFKVDLFDWTRDHEAAIDAAHAALPGKPLYLLGHSLGAQLRGFLTNQVKVSGMLSVADGSGYWRDTTARLQRVVPYFWFFVVPLATLARRSYAGARFPVLALSITDDEMITMRSSQTLVDLYENAPREVLRVTPTELSVRRLGHFGAFLSEHQALLWPRLDQWLAGLQGTRA